MAVGTRFRSSVSCGEHLKFGYYEIPFKPFVKSLYVLLDSNLTVSKQVGNLCRRALLEIRRFGIIGPFWTEKAITQPVCCRILNRLDCCNSLLAGTTSEQMSRIQRVQNNAANLILKRKAGIMLHHFLTKLHWLPYKQKIDVKIATLAYRHFNNTLPSYLSARPVSYTHLTLPTTRMV